MLRRTNVITMAVGLVAGSLALLTPSNASAADSPCSHRSYSNKSAEWGVLNGNFNLKVEPATECDNVGSGSTNQKIYFWCKTVNFYHNGWVYVRIAGTTKQGWISINNVSPKSFPDQPNTWALVGDC